MGVGAGENMSWSNANFPWEGAWESWAEGVWVQQM